MAPRKEKLRAKIEPFDTFWEAPDDIEKGYHSFGKFYKTNYLKYFPKTKTANILVISCGPGYLLNLLKDEGYTNVTGVDSSAEKARHATAKGLNCKVEQAFDTLEQSQEQYDVIFAEQEINHLDKDEVLEFLNLSRNNLKDDGLLIVHSLNGANPITGAEALAQNYDHYTTFTEYSLRQILEYSHFQEIEVFPLKLYIFYRNPLNYIGMLVDTVLNFLFRVGFIFYGKKNKIFSKKIGACCKKG